MKLDGEKIAKIIAMTSSDEEIEKIVEKIVDGKLKGELLSKFPMIAMFLSDSMINKIKEYLRDVINENKGELVDIIARKLEESIDFKDVVKEKIEHFSLMKLERIVITIAKNELKHIEVLGGVLGAIIGVMQFIVTDIIMKG